MRQENLNIKLLANCMRTLKKKKTTTTKKQQQHRQNIGGKKLVNITQPIRMKE